MSLTHLSADTLRGSYFALQRFSHHLTSIAPTVLHLPPQYSRVRPTGVPSMKYKPFVTGRDAQKPSYLLGFEPKRASGR
jgi:hypothetical protein